MTGKALLTGCSQCARYSKPLGRCIDGKISPRTYKGAVDAVKFCGFTYICKYTVNGDKFRTKILEETYKGLAQKEESNASQLQESRL